MPQIHLRPAREADANAIAHIHVQAWQQAYVGLVPDDVLKHLSVDARARYWREAIASGQPDVIVAERDEALVGWLALGPCRDRGVAADAGEVWALYVSPAHWSTGVGRALWQQARSSAADHGYRSLSLWVLADNVRGRRFYESMGLHRDPDRTQSTQQGDRTLREVRYVWFRRDRPPTQA